MSRSIPFADRRGRAGWTTPSVRSRGNDLGGVSAEAKPGAQHGSSGSRVPALVAWGWNVVLAAVYAGAGFVGIALLATALVGVVGGLVGASARRLVVASAAVLLMQVAWMNLHTTAVLGPLLVAAYGLGYAMSRRAEWKRILTRAVALAVLCAAACLATPYGIAPLTRRPRVDRRAKRSLRPPRELRQLTAWNEPGFGIRFLDQRRVSCVLSLAGAPLVRALAGNVGWTVRKRSLGRVLLVRKFQVADRTMRR